MEPVPSPRELEGERTRCFNLAAAAFSNNELDLEHYEAIAAEIAAAEGLPALRDIGERLPAIPDPPPVTAQAVKAHGSSIRRSGRWLESPMVEVSGRGSRIILDFTAYASEAQLRVSLNVECNGSSVIIIVPESIDVIDRIDSNRASVVRDKHRPSAANSAITLTGAISGSRIKIKRKRHR